MGCCNSNTNTSRISSNFIEEKLKEAIDNDNIKRLNIIIKLSPPNKSSTRSLIDSEITCHNNKHLNPLAYALLLGKEKIFKFLYEKGARLQIMENLLESQDLCAINIICYKGHLELLKYYLPLYLSSYESLEQNRSFTIDLKDQPTQTLSVHEPAIHSACKAGSLNIIAYLYQFFKQRPCPRQFNINTLDEIYSEDCALMACRYGNYNLIKFFYESCNADFFKLNKHKENSIMICISGFKKAPKYSYIECIMYLVEKVGVDVTYMHEEALLIAENEEIIEYLEGKLEEKGIFTKKKDLDNYMPKLEIFVEDEVCSKQSLFTQAIREFLDDGRDPSILSSITDSRSKLRASSLSELESIKNSVIEREKVN